MSVPANSDSYYNGANEVTTPNLGFVQKQVERERLTNDALGVVLVMVGLPARGKSFISRRLERFLCWRGLSTKMFNVGKYRREATAPEESGRSDFFDSGNKAAKQARERAAATALSDVLAFLDGGGQIAIYDATNSVAERRNYIRDRVTGHTSKYCVIFVEVICDDKEVIEVNMNNKVSNSPDFRNMTMEEALNDLKIRIAKYEEVYESVKDAEGSYIKLFNLSSKIMANHCYGRIAKSVLPYLMGIHVGARPVFLVRAGAGEEKPQAPSSCDRLSRLSSSGQSFASSLAEFVRARSQRYWREAGKKEEPMHVVTSTVPRAVASVCDTTLRHDQTSALNPLDKGPIGDRWWGIECFQDVPPWHEVQRRYPDFWVQFLKDPLQCRFPGGESYMDVIRRLEGLIIEVEACTRPVLIVSHLTVLQLLLSYFHGTSLDEAWKMPVPKHSVVEVLPSLGGGFQCQEHSLLSTACMDANADKLVADEMGPQCKRTRTQ